MGWILGVIVAGFALTFCVVGLGVLLARGAVALTEHAMKDPGPVDGSDMDQG